MIGMAGRDGIRDRRGVTCAVLAAAFATACAGSSGGDATPVDSGDAGLADAVPTDGTEAGDTSTDGTGNADALVGAFQVSLVAAVDATETIAATPAYTTVVGQVGDGPTPGLILWETVATDGDCILETPVIPVCSTPCGSSAACVRNETCQAYPTAESVGTVTVTGIATSTGATTFTMDPVGTGETYQAADQLPNPAFAEGDAITLAAAGSAFTPAFTLAARGIAALDLQNDVVTLASGQPVTLTWTAPGKAGISTVTVKLDISHHGGSKGMIECSAPDTGSLTLPSSLLDSLVDLGAAGFPTIVVDRKATGSATIPAGRVDLIVYSEAERDVTVPGVTSCTKDADCPGGQTCQTDLTCK